MLRLILALSLPLFGGLAGCAVAGGQETCARAPAVREARRLLDADPVAAARRLADAARCDAVYALLYRAEAVIAAETREEFYWQGQVYPHGWYDQDPTPFEAYVIEHPERFVSASEGMPGIQAGDFWLDSLEDRRHPVIGTAQLAEIRASDGAAWEDGDGTAQLADLLAAYRGWLERWPDHPGADEVRERIAELEDRRPR